MSRRLAGRRAGLIGVALLGVLAGCGGATPSTTTTPTPSAALTPLPTPSPPAPLVVTFKQTGPSQTPWSAMQLSLIGEDGTVAATFNDPGGVDGDSYTVGRDHVYFIDGTTVKAMAPDGSVTDAGQVPQVSTTVTADEKQGDTALAVSPDESTFVFGIPLSIDTASNSDHSQLWTEPVGGTAASATMVYDDASTDGTVLLPYAWSVTSIWVSRLSTEGLGGAGPFLDYSHFGATTFDPTTHVLSPAGTSCSPDPNSVCIASDAPENSSTLTVHLSSGTTTVTMVPAMATAFGAEVVSSDGRYLAYGAFIGDFAGLGSGHYVATVVDLGTGATVASVVGYTPVVWLEDDRLVVSQSFHIGPTYLLSPTFSSPVKIAPDEAVSALR